MCFTQDAELSPTPGLLSPLTLPRRLSIFSLTGGGGGGGSSSLKRMSTTKVSKSTDALSSLDSPSTAPSSPFTLVRTRGGLRSSFMNLFRPTLGVRRHPCSPAVDASSSATTQPATPIPATRPMTLARGRLPSDCSADLHRSAASAATDDEEEDSVTGSTGSTSVWSCRSRSLGDCLEAAAPPALPRRPPHLLQLPSTPMCIERPRPLLPPLPMRQLAPALHVPSVRRLIVIR